MPEREALDLTSILRQYELFAPVRPEAPVLPMDGEGDLRFAVPTRLGKGPLLWSTCMALVHVGRICHDVNGYYRELGVHWQASRWELAQAYQAKNGQESPRLTYILKQLLNTRIRDAYDRMQPGEVFRDEYSDPERVLKRKAQREAARRVLRGEAVSATEVLDEWGYVLLDDDELDKVNSVGKDQDRWDDPWDYSYYAWKASSYLADESRLRRWQELLSIAAAQRGVSPSVILGTTALSDQSFMLEDVNGSPVIFFSEGTPPSLSVAQEAIGQLLNFTPLLPA